MRRQVASCLLAAYASIGWAQGQASHPAPAACPAAQTLGAQHLFGQWRAQIDGAPGIATLQLGPDPEQDDSVVGSIRRAGRVAQVAGELQNGEFTLEESDDGTRISATWSGQLQDAACGQEITGLWTNVLDDQSHAFVLRKQAGWQ